MDTRACRRAMKRCKNSVDGEQRPNRSAAVNIALLRQDRSGTHIYDCNFLAHAVHCLRGFITLQWVSGVSRDLFQRERQPNPFVHNAEVSPARAMRQTLATRGPDPRNINARRWSTGPCELMRSCNFVKFTTCPCRTPTTTSNPKTPPNGDTAAF